MGQGAAVGGLTQKLLEWAADKILCPLNEVLRLHSGLAQANFWEVEFESETHTRISVTERASARAAIASPGFWLRTAIASPDQGYGNPCGSLR